MTTITDDDIIKAISEQNMLEVEQLLKVKPQADRKDFIINAVQQGLNMFVLIRKYMNIKQPNKYLFYATFYGHLDVVQFIFQHYQGLKLNYHSWMVNTFQVGCVNDRIDIINFYLQSGLYIPWISPLRWNGYSDEVKTLLLESGMFNLDIDDDKIRSKKVPLLIKINDDIACYNRNMSFLLFCANGNVKWAKAHITKMKLKYNKIVVSP